MALQSSPSSFSHGFTYDVFLSFRGLDTRFGFTGNLYHALDGNGIHTFIDDRELHGGDEITPSLLKAIEESRIFIPVFSINYASSSFCLDELVHIMECSKAKNRLVVPVFYEVDPTHVRHQTGSYGKAIAKHEHRFQNKYTHLINILVVLFLLPFLLYPHGFAITLLLLLLPIFLLQNNNEDYTDSRNRLRKWKKALNQTANLSGHHFNPRDGYEHEVVRKIVKEVSNKINRVPLHVADYPVGLESRVWQVKSLLHDRSDNGVHRIGIIGMGGIGKTTLARAIYNFIADQFECLCFLHNVRENSIRNGLKHLQEELLAKTVGLHIQLGDVNERIPMIKQRLHRKKVLLILDDVDKPEQLQALAGGLDWFGLGSNVIITTRNTHLLASHGIKSTYRLNGLNGEEALDLLRRRAFENNIVDSSYGDILNRTVAYASGLPLAIEIVGSNLFGKPKEDWESTLDRYGKIPNKEIQKILQVSFDDLEEDEQSVFLDIACCFKGHRLEEVKDILHAHYGDNMKYHIGVLVAKSLIKIDKGHVTLHDLIEDMGKEIVRQKSPIKLGKRSRLWLGQDIVQVLQENMGTSEIEIIYLDCPSIEEVHWNGNAFEKMKNLKTLIIKSGHFSQGPTHFPSSLRVLVWQRYPSQCLPSNFYPENLALCNLSNGCVTSFEFTSSLNKKFVNLKFLNFDNCANLIHIPDVSGIPNLEEFSFSDCWNLHTIHNSVGCLNKLKRLNARGCRKLRNFPSIKLTSLQELELSDCKCLKSFPEILEEMQKLRCISLMGTSIKELPFSFQNLTGLRGLTIKGNGMLELSNILASSITVRGYQLSLPKENGKLSSVVFSNVESVNLQECNLTDEFLPIVLTWFANVRWLNLSQSKFTILPECIKECRYLSSLHLDDCKHLQEISGIPPNLKDLSALRCESLTTRCRNNLLNQQLHEAGSTNLCLPVGNERIPEWFEHQCRGPSISFWFRKCYPSVALLVAIKSMHKGYVYSYLKFSVCINGYAFRFPCFGHVLKIQPGHTYLSHLNLGYWVHHQINFSGSLNHPEFFDKLRNSLSKNEWIHVDVTLMSSMMKMETGLLIETGMHVLKKKSSMGDIQFTNPHEEKRKLDGVWVKLNCDVAVSHGSNAVACGGILRDHLGSFLGGFAGQLGEIPILRAELKAIPNGLQFARSRGYRKVIVESDSLYTIQLFKKKCFPPGDSWNLVGDEVVLNHTSSNQLANGFAKHGLELSCNQGLVIFDDFPSFTS